MQDVSSDDVFKVTTEQTMLYWWQRHMHYAQLNLFTCNRASLLRRVPTWLSDLIMEWLCFSFHLSPLFLSLTVFLSQLFLFLSLLLSFSLSPAVSLSLSPALSLSLSFSLSLSCCLSLSYHFVPCTLTGSDIFFGQIRSKEPTLLITFGETKRRHKNLIWVMVIRFPLSLLPTAAGPFDEYFP